ncbi:phosphotyrosine protein phosphatase [Mycena amicta]|nr:phosphotyrosine protein phosphatase [Mycena amicta]
MTEDSPVAKVLVVCLGNICRSPMGEAVLRFAAKERGIRIEVDSCGTAGYHVGDDPDDTWVHVRHVDGRGSLRRNRSDFIEFTHILASDDSNLRDIKRVMPPNATAEVRLWGSYLDGNSIPDPWYGSLSGFERVFEQCTALSKAFLDQLVVE